VSTYAGIFSTPIFPSRNRINMMRLRNIFTYDGISRFENAGLLRIPPPFFPLFITYSMMVSPGLRMPAFTRIHPQRNAVLESRKNDAAPQQLTYDGISRFENAGLLRILHHPQRDAVLDAAAGVEELTLCHWKK
jgi:hypothetical protein